MDFSEILLSYCSTVSTLETVRVFVLAILETRLKCFFKSQDNFSANQMRFIISNKWTAASSSFCYFFDKFLVASFSKAKSMELHIICGSWNFNNLLLIIDHSISQHENPFLFFWPLHPYCVIYRFKNSSSSKITVKLFKLFDSGLDSLLVIFEDFCTIDFHCLESWSKTDDREGRSMWKTTKEDL